jgi:hypothetical protein
LGLTLANVGTRPSSGPKKFWLGVLKTSNQPVNLSAIPQKADIQSSSWDVRQVLVIEISGSDLKDRSASEATKAVE